MARDLLKNLSFFLLAAAIFSFASGAFAAVQPAEASEEVCISKSIEDKVTTCPGGFKMGKFKKTPKAKVTTTEKKEVQKKKVELGPTLGREYTQKIIESSFKKKREKKKIDILKKEIELLKRLAAQTPRDNPERAEILKRIADGYQEFYEQINYMARDLDEKIFQAEKKDKKKASTMKAQQKKLDEKARQFRELAIKAYVEIRNGFPDYPDYDEILFAIAYEIDQLASEIEDPAKKTSYRERARVFYQELIRNHPQSKFIPHAWMSFGEYYFHEARDVERAIKSYEKVVQWGEKDNPNYIIAMYYQAWCLFNMQQYQQAIDQFAKVIAYAEANPENPEGKAIAKRSRMELVDSFSKIGNPAQAWKFFERVGADLAHPMLVKLANLYYDEGHWADAIIVFHKLEALEIENFTNNNGNELCEYQTMVSNAVISSRPKDEQLVELKRQLGVYQKFSSEGNHDPAKVNKCRQDSILMAWDIATHWHIEAVGSESAPGTKDKNTMEMTIQVYDEILKTFPNLAQLSVEGFDENTKPTNYRVAFFKAELFWNMEDWGRCGPAFDDVVKMDPSGDYTSDAAYAAVLCYNKIYVQDRGETDKERKHKLNTNAEEDKCSKECVKCKKLCKGEDKEACLKKCEESDKQVFKPRELTALEKGILTSYERYVCYVTEGEDLLNIKYRRARIYYEANMFAEAAVLFKDIAMNNSDSELAIYAANLYLDCLNVLGSMVEVPNPACYDDLAVTVDVFIDTTKAPGARLMKDAEFAQQIKSLKVGVLRKKAESLNSRGRFKEAAEIYLVIFREYKGVYDDRGMCEVLFNTAINMEAARLVMPAIKVRQKMIELYPDCEHSKKAAYYIGQNYHALQFFQQAADNYRSFAIKYAGEPESPEALSNAITFYIGLGNYDEAWKSLAAYEKSYRVRKPAETASVDFGAGYIYLNEAKETKEDKAWDAVIKYYDQYQKKYAKANLLDEQVQAHVFIGEAYWNKRKPDYAKAESSFKKAIAIFDKNAMDKVVENSRKAAMLNATAKARYYVAELKFQEFSKIDFPQFVSEKKVPDKIDKWWKKKSKPEDIQKAAEWRKQRRMLARWGYWDEGKPRKEQMEEVTKEEKKEDSEIQFNYWLEYSFKPWMEKKSKVLNEATDMFVAVAKMSVPEWEMAAAARAGDMQREYMEALYNAPIPPSIKDDQELVDIYRGAMDEKAEPFRLAAIGGYDRCLTVSTKVRWFNENSLRCEAELAKLDPRKYPISEEIRVTPKNELSIWAVPEPILALETDAEKREKSLKQSADAMGGAAETE